MALSVDQLIALLEELPGHAQVRIFADPDEPRGFAAESVSVRSDFDQEVARNDEEDYVYILGGPPIEQRSDEAPWNAGYS